MGAWGASLFDDDLAIDARGAFEEALGSGSSPADAADRVLRQFREALGDMDEGPVLDLALGSLLLDHGSSDIRVCGAYGR